MACVNSNFQEKSQQLNIQTNIENKQANENQYKLKEQPKQTDLFILKELSLIHKDLFTSNQYFWIDQIISSLQNQKTLLLLKQQGFNPVLFQNMKQCNSFIENNKNNVIFRIITSPEIAEAVCNQFKSNEKVVHIYIYGKGQKSAGQALRKKVKKIKFYADDEQQFIKNIKQQSRYDNKFIDLPNFLKITNKNNDHDNTMINKSRYNLHGLLRFKNRVQAKEDFIKFAKHFYSVEDKAFKSNIEQFQTEYPVQLDLKLSLNWYTRPTFFYGFLNNMLKTTSNPLQTPYLRHPFQSTFKAIKKLYDQTQKKSFKVYRGGFINNQQLKYMEENVGEYIEMYGFVSTSEDYDVAEGFRKQYDGNSLMTILIQDQDRQTMVDYGYASLVEYSDLPSEKQVLFNSLNVFKIVSYTIQDGINKVTLKYGQLARMVKLGLEKVPQKQKNIIYNYNHQQEIISKYIINQGDVFQYCQMYDREVEYREKWIIDNKGVQNQELAQNLNKLGSVHKNKAEHGKALQYFQRSLKIYTNIFGQNHIETARTLQDIGVVYYSKADYHKALQYYQKSLKICMNIVGEYHTDTAMTLQNIGVVYDQKAQYEKALQYYQRSLKISMNILGENHTDSARTIQNIGVVYDQKADYDRALQYYQRSLKIYMNILGEDHTETARTLQNIGIVYDQKAHYDKALQYYQRSLKIYTNIVGENHSETARTLQNIGVVYRNKADYHKALQYYQRSLKIKLNILGENHIDSARTIQNIGVVYYCKADYDKALQYYQRSLKIYMNIVGEDHTETARTIQNIGVVYDQKAEYDKALQYFQRSLKINTNILGENHIATAMTLYNIGFSFSNQKKYVMAKQYFTRCYAIRLKIFGPKHNLTKVVTEMINKCNRLQDNTKNNDI